MTTQLIAIGIIILGLIWLTSRPEPTAEKIRKLRQENIIVAKTSQIVCNQRKSKFSTREYTRCQRCGRPHSVYRKFGLCRECMRDLAHKGQLPGVKKASW